MSAGQTTTPGRLAVSPMALLASGVPLTLLLDLVCGPRSAELLREEGCRTTRLESLGCDAASSAPPGR